MVVDGLVGREVVEVIFYRGVYFAFRGQPAGPMAQKIVPEGEHAWFADLIRVEKTNKGGRARFQLACPSVCASVEVVFDLIAKPNRE